MRIEYIGVGIDACGLGAMIAGPTKKWPGYLLLLVGTPLIIYGFWPAKVVPEKEHLLPTPIYNVKSQYQSGGVTAGNISAVNIESSSSMTNRREKAKRRKIIDRLTNFVKEGWELEGRARSGQLNEQWSRDFDKWQHTIMDYLTKNLGSSYAERFNRPSAENLPSALESNPYGRNPYQGQDQSEWIREKIKYLYKLIDELQKGV